MSILVLSCSLNPNSKSKTLAETVTSQIKALGTQASLLDLAKIELPFCDGGKSYEHPNVVALNQHVAAASGIVFAVPIYNYDVNSTAKTVIEHAGRAMTDKTVGFVAAAGGQGSYMSLMPFANSLMLDFRCHIIPRFVYTTGNAFDEQNNLVDSDVHARLRNFVGDMIRVSSALSKE